MSALEKWNKNSSLRLISTLQIPPYLESLAKFIAKIVQVVVLKVEGANKGLFTLEPIVMNPMLKIA